MNESPIEIVSLGAGVQSTTMALMAAAGEITPMPTAAIFADTQAEPKSVYKHLDWLEKQLPFPVYRVSQGSLTEACLNTRVNQTTWIPYYSNMLPCYTLNSDGTQGRVGRHCTYNYKIVPIVRKVRELAGIKRGETKIRVTQWIGISLDEMRRMKESRDLWSRHRWPLIEKRMTRQACLDWMEKKGYPMPPRSACVYCPFHSSKEWRRLQLEEPEGFAEAVRVEGELQTLHASITANGKIRGTPFLHRCCKPLDTIDFRSDVELGQMVLWDDECTGMCGV